MSMRFRPSKVHATYCLRLFLLLLCPALAYAQTNTAQTLKNGVIVLGSDFKTSLQMVKDQGFQLSPQIFKNSNPAYVNLPQIEIMQAYEGDDFKGNGGQHDLYVIEAINGKVMLIIHDVTFANGQEPNLAETRKSVIEKFAAHPNPPDQPLLWTLDSQGHPGRFAVCFTEGNFQLNPFYNVFSLNVFSGGGSIPQCAVAGSASLGSPFGSSPLLKHMRIYLIDNQAIARFNQIINEDARGAAEKQKSAGTRNKAPL